MTKENQRETTYLIRVDRELWQEWKKYIPRDISMNEAIVELIEKDVATKEKEKEKR